jgi:hypothetical protein
MERTAAARLIPRAEFALGIFQVDGPSAPPSWGRFFRLSSPGPLCCRYCVHIVEDAQVNQRQISLSGHVEAGADQRLHPIAYQLFPRGLS